MLTLGEMCQKRGMSRERGHAASEIYSGPIQTSRIDSSPVFWLEPGETARLTTLSPWKDLG